VIDLEVGLAGISVIVGLLVACGWLTSRLRAYRSSAASQALKLAELQAQLNEANFKYMSEPEDPRFSFRVGMNRDRRGFDELVVGGQPVWIHLECMGVHDELSDGSEDPDGAMCWWARIGDAHLWISVPRSGEPVLDVQRGYYDDVRGRTSTGEVGSDQRCADLAAALRLAAPLPWSAPDMSDAYLADHGDPIAYTEAKDARGNDIGNFHYYGAAALEVIDLAKRLGR
jgi:hypothetical protein